MSWLYHCQDDHELQLTMTKGLSKTLRTEFEAYCSSASTHGLGYFFKFSLLERVFWVLATSVMLILGCLLIHQLWQDWEENPTLLKTDTSRRPIESVAMPSITICNSFTPDKWGMLRRLLNEATFLCNSDEACQDTDELRQFFNSQFMTSLEERGESGPAGFLQQLVTQFWAHIEHQLSQVDSLSNDPLMFKLLTEDKYSFEVFNFLHHINRSLPYFHQMPEYRREVGYYLDKKMSGLRDAYGIQRDLNMTTFTWHKLMTNRFGVDKYSSDTAVLIAITLALPGPGRFGSFFFNYAQDMEEARYWEPLKEWNNPAINSSTYDQLQMNQLYVDLFNKLFNSNANVSLADIAPILTPMPNYVDDRRYSVMFRHTAHTQAVQTQGLSGPTFSYLDQLPTFLTKTNYFGKLFGANMLQVMEVMYHNSLRVGRFRDNWFRHPDLYSRHRLEELLPFQLGLDDNVTMHAKVEDFAKEELSFRPVLERGRLVWISLATKNLRPGTDFRFDHGTPIHFSNDSARAEANQILEELRKKYQHQQMMLFCRDNSGQSCESRFKPVVTDMGICYAMNTPKMSQVMRPSTFYQYFTSIFPDYTAEAGNFGNLTTGYTLTMILDSHQSAVFDHEPGSFWIGINQQNDFMAIKEHGVEAEPGMQTNILVSPSVYESTRRFKDTPILTRSCRFNDEVTDNAFTTFNNYSFKSCEFDCKLQHSRAKCGCTPWNYPQSDDVVIQICDGVQAHCFGQAMGEDYDKDECSCLQDCDEFVYDLSSFQHKVNVDKLCDLRQQSWEHMLIKDLNGSNWASTRAPKKHKGQSGSKYDLTILIGEKLRHLDGAEQKYWLQRLMSDNFAQAAYDLFSLNRYAKYVAPEVLAEYCSQMATTDLAFVTIEVPGSLASKFVRDLQFSFTDKISSLGGTIGLFTGMSLLSVVETIYWLVRMIIVPMRVEAK